MGDRYVEGYAITDFSILISLKERILDLRVVTVEPAVNVGNFDKRVSVIAIVTLLKAGKMMQLQLNTNLTFASNPGRLNCSIAVFCCALQSKYFLLRC